MANDYYNVTGNPATQGTLSSAAIRAEFAAIQTGFALLPGLTGNANTVVMVNSGATALTVLATTGTGSIVRSASPTFTGTITAASATFSGTLGVTGVATFTAQPILSSLTASLPVSTDGSKGLVSSTVTGTGSVVLSASPTFTGHITVEAVTATGATGTGKFVFDASPTISGHMTVEGVTATGATGTGKFVFDTSPVLVTPALGTVASGVLSACTTATQTALDASTKLASTAYVDAATTLLPQNSKSTAYTTVLADAGKHIYHPVGDNNARTFTIDSNANVPYTIGTTLTFVNDKNTVTIAITSDTLVLANSGTTGSRTLVETGIATALKVTSTRWLISGAGLT